MCVKGTARLFGQVGRCVEFKDNGGMKRCKNQCV